MWRSTESARTSRVERRMSSGIGAPGSLGPGSLGTSIASAGTASANRTRPCSGVQAQPGGKVSTAQRQSSSNARISDAKRTWPSRRAQ
ncbi:unannotated protein [freshwater metagenome]|uniref:Unannotated protein n=1 Tax=freshwater metagenome TaxID=449393 RepID=A0A6J7G894_9ZZZZ